MTTQIYSLTNEEMENNLQVAKYCLLQHMFDNEKIDEKVFEDYMKNYALILRKPSFFNNVWAQLAGKKPGDERLRMIIVRQETINDQMMKNEAKEEEDKKKKKKKD